MNDEQLLRYSRQIMLPYVDIEGQQKLLDARVLVVGLGGLGSPVAMYLAAAGIGHLVLNDFDKVDLTNLQRQIIHRQNNIGETKTNSAAETLRALNPEVNITTIAEAMDEKAMRQQVEAADVVLDCTDNFSVRFMLNKLCVKTRTVLVSGAAVRMEGQVSVFDNQGQGPCYRCLYKDDDGELSNTCSENGVLAPVVGIIGSIQAVEAMKVIMSVGEPLISRLLLLDARTMEWRSLKLPKDPECPVCG